MQNVDKKTVFYGIKNEKADYIAKDIQLNENGLPSFTVYRKGEPLVNLSLQVGGEHNILNATAVTAAADFLGLSMDAVKAGLEAFIGTKRRFEKLGECNGCDVIDDYAHHPTEIKATLDTAKKMNYNKIWAVFQPHTYTRTKSLLDDFARVLAEADNLLIADIYPAREEYDGTIHSCDLALMIPKAIYMSDMNAIARYLKENISPGDLVITMGAGDVNKIGYQLVK